MTQDVIFALFIIRSTGITVELTRRRESTHPSPHQVSYETRYRRSRPTICYVAPLLDKRATQTQEAGLGATERLEEFLRFPRAVVAKND